MFRHAHELATRFTFPVVISRMTVAGDCSSDIAAFVVINRDGWAVTANHVASAFGALSREVIKTREWRGKREEIEADPKLNAKDKERALSDLGELDHNTAERYSAFWGVGRGRTSMTQALSVELADVALVKLEPFDPNWVGAYPKFKDPGASDFRPGASLCKFGYPFHTIRPTWDADAERFKLPDAALPIPFFPIEGIFTRSVNIIDARLKDNPPSFPLRHLETSSPGLRGQSGGPTLDVAGNVWAIQCLTYHFPLGFDPVVPGRPNGATEHQFLNVGRGVHAETLHGFFGEAGISFEVAA